MIIRISGDAQYDVDDGELERLEAIDDAIEEAVQAGDAPRFRRELERLLALVRDAGRVLATDELVASDLILPPDDVTLGELAGGLTTEGLIPDEHPPVKATDM